MEQAPSFEERLDVAARNIGARLLEALVRLTVSIFLKRHHLAAAERGVRDQMRIPGDRIAFAARPPVPGMDARRPDLVDQGLRVVVEASKLLSLRARKKDSHLKLDEVPRDQVVPIGGRPGVRRRTGNLLDQDELAIRCRF